jgi:hypothetical protein
MGNLPGPKPYKWTIEKIEAKGTPEGDCIVWTGASGGGGYPMMRYLSKVNNRGLENPFAVSKMRTVHSVIAEMKYGKVPNRESIHKVTRTCKNIKCINSKHIVIKTKGAIMSDAHQTGFNTLLNADQVRAIRKEYDEQILYETDHYGKRLMYKEPKTGKWSMQPRRRQNGNTIHRCGAQLDLAKKYGVNSRMIWNVVRKRLYRWVK